MKAWLQQNAERWACAGLALGVAWLLKRHYSQASADELRWILTPTAWLTALATRTEFAFRAGEGYLSREQSVLIAPACAGVNFLIVALLALQLGFGGSFQTRRGRALWLVGSLALAFVATLLVNTLRISLSIALGHLAARELGLTFQSVHRLLGIATYLAGLLALCLTVQVWLPSRAVAPGHILPWAARFRRAVRTGPLLVALGCYAGVTLAVPLLRGAAHNPDFWSHAAPVSVLVVVSVALLFAARGRNWDDGRHEFRSPEQHQ